MRTGATVLLSAVIHASELRAYMSAPVKVGGHFSAMVPRSMSSTSSNLRVRACRTLSLESESSATPTYSSTSRRPGRSKAGSIRSGLHNQTHKMLQWTAPADEQSASNSRQVGSKARKVPCKYLQLQTDQAVSRCSRALSCYCLRARRAWRAVVASVNCAHKRVGGKVRSGSLEN